MKHTQKQKVAHLRGDLESFRFILVTPKREYILALCHTLTRDAENRLENRSEKCLENACGKSEYDIFQMWERYALHINIEIYQRWKRENQKRYRYFNSRVITKRHSIDILNFSIKDDQLD